MARALRTPLLHITTVVSIRGISVSRSGIVPSGISCEFGMRAISNWNGLRRWRLREEATVTRPAKMRGKERRLSFELMDRAIDVWFPFPNTHVAGKVTRGQIVGTIDYDVVTAD